MSIFLQTSISIHYLLPPHSHYISLIISSASRERSVEPYEDDHTAKESRVGQYSHIMVLPLHKVDENLSVQTPSLHVSAAKFCSVCLTYCCILCYWTVLTLDVGLES